MSTDLRLPLGVRFVGNELQIRCDNPLVEEASRFVFRHHVHQQVSDNCVNIDVLTSDSGGGFLFVVGGQVTAVASNQSELPTILMQLGQRLLVSREPSLGMLHAAVLIKNGGGVLFPAKAGSGKTTLAAWLLGHGYELLSDELASVGEFGVMDGLTRPLNVKPGTRLLLDHFDWMGASVAQSIRSCGVTLVPWDRCQTTGLAPRVIVFPTYTANASLEIERLSDGRCVQGLMGSLLNARNLPKHGLSFAARLAGTCPAYRMRYSHLADVSNWLDQFLVSDASTAGQQTGARSG